MAVAPGGPGSAPGSAPSKITTIVIDQPIGEVRGNQVYALMTFAQLIQRIVSYLGQPGSGSGGVPSGNTVTQDVASASATAAFAAFGPAIEGMAAATQPPALTGFPPNSPDGGETSGGVLALMQGMSYAQGVIAIGDLLVLNGQTLDGEIWAPVVTGVLPGPDLVADPFGQCVMVRIE
jgi:hypothetical protein